jgi:hypothetical protein
MKFHQFNRLLVLMLLFCFGTSLGMAQPTSSPQGDLPAVFLIGEHEGKMKTVQSQHQQSLLEVCNNDMGRAFDLWMSLTQEIEAYSKQIDFDISGVRAWFHVFFAKDGSIRHIGYHLKPTSRNINDEEFKAFLKSFINHYRFPLTSNTPYFNYTSVHFPTMYNLPANK